MSRAAAVLSHVDALLLAVRTAVLARRPLTALVALVKHEGRVAAQQGDTGEDHHDALEDDERNLLAEEGAGVAVLELGDTVGAAGEDKEGGGEEAGEEDDGAPGGKLAAGAAGAGEADEVVGKGAEEDDEHNDLQGEARHGDVDAGAVVALLLGGEGAAGGLQDEADDVKGDEDPVEELGVEARQVGGEVDDGLGEGDVDGGGKEDGGDGEADCRVVSGFFQSWGSDTAEGFGTY